MPGLTLDEQLRSIREKQKELSEKEAQIKAKQREKKKKEDLRKKTALGELVASVLRKEKKIDYYSLSKSEREEMDERIKKVLAEAEFDDSDNSAAGSGEGTGAGAGAADYGWHPVENREGRMEEDCSSNIDCGASSPSGFKVRGNQ